MEEEGRKDGKEDQETPTNYEYVKFFLIFHFPQENVEKLLFKGTVD